MEAFVEIVVLYRSAILLRERIRNRARADERREYRRKYREEHLAAQREHNRKWKERHPGLEAQRAKERAERRKLEAAEAFAREMSGKAAFVTLEDLVQSARCTKARSQAWRRRVVRVVRAATAHIRASRQFRVAYERLRRERQRLLEQSSEEAMFADAASGFFRPEMLVRSAKRIKQRLKKRRYIRANREHMRVYKHDYRFRWNADTAALELLIAMQSIKVIKPKEDQ